MYAGVAMGMLSLLKKTYPAGTIAHRSGLEPSNFMPAFMQPIQIKALRPSIHFS
jgi:hypothetical protein